eukprot:5407927-Pleurochrysis_carterae.AAC.2
MGAPLVFNANVTGKSVVSRACASYGLDSWRVSQRFALAGCSELDSRPLRLAAQPINCVGTRTRRQSAFAFFVFAERSEGANQKYGCRPCIRHVLMYRCTLRRGRGTRGGVPRVGQVTDLRCMKRCLSMHIRFLPLRSGSWIGILDARTCTLSQPVARPLFGRAARGRRGRLARPPPVPRAPRGCSYIRATFDAAEAFIIDLVTTLVICKISPLARICLCLLLVQGAQTSTRLPDTTQVRVYFVPNGFGTNQSRIGNYSSKMRAASSQGRSGTNRGWQIVAGGESAGGLAGTDVQGASSVVRAAILAHHAPAGFAHALRAREGSSSRSRCRFRAAASSRSWRPCSRKTSPLDRQGGERGAPLSEHGHAVANEPHEDDHEVQLSHRASDKLWRMENMLMFERGPTRKPTSSTSSRSAEGTEARLGVLQAAPQQGGRATGEEGDGGVDGVRKSANQLQRAA